MAQEHEQVQEQPKDIKIRLIENAVLVSANGRMLSFPTWADASEHIAARLEKLRRERDCTPKRGC